MFCYSVYCVLVRRASFVCWFYLILLIQRIHTSTDTTIVLFKKVCIFVFTKAEPRTQIFFKIITIKVSNSISKIYDLFLIFWFWCCCIGHTINIKKTRIPLTVLTLWKFTADAGIRRDWLTPNTIKKLRICIINVINYTDVMLLKDREKWREAERRELSNWTPQWPKSLCGEQFGLHSEINSL